MSNTFKRGETAVIDAELVGLDSSISDVSIKIDDKDGYPVVYSTAMADKGNQKYRYCWDTSPAYSGYSGWSGYSSFSGGVSGGIITSGYSGYSGYSAYIIGLFTTTIMARDAEAHYGSESFKIRINE